MIKLRILRNHQPSETRMMLRAGRAAWLSTSVKKAHDHSLSAPSV